MKVFISQPMKGLTQAEILSKRGVVVDRVHELFPEAEIIDSYCPDYADAGNVNAPLKYLARSIELLAEADMAVFCAGWQNARGCRIENECAVAYGIPAVDELLTAEKG